MVFLSILVILNLGYFTFEKPVTKIKMTKICLTH